LARRSALLNAAFTFTGQLAARLLGLVFYALLVRTVGAERFGDQAFGAAVGTLFVTFVEPGLNPVLVRDGARDAGVLRERLAEALGYKLAALLVVWPLSVGACALLGYRGAVLWAVLFAGGTILLAAFEDLASSALVAAERLDLEGALRFTSKLLGAGLGLAAIALHASYETILGAVTGGAMLTAVAGMWLVSRAGVRPGVTLHPLRLLSRLRETWLLAVTSILWMLTLRLDQILASRLGLGHESLGHYGAVVKIIEALMLFPNALAVAFQPRLSVTWLQGAERCSEQLRLAFAGVFALTLGLAAGGACLAPGLVKLAFGADFAPSAPLLALQLFCLPLLSVHFLGTHTLVAAGRTRSLAIVVAVNMIVNVALNLVLLPRVGIVGACVSALAGGTAGALLMWRTLRALGLRPGLLRALARPVLAAAVMASVLRLTPVAGWPLAAALAVGAAVYVAMFLATGGLSVLRGLRAKTPEGAPQAAA
jgi:O-antigen/teichoic acid export membrane protein